MSVYVDNYSINCLLRLKLFDPVKKSALSYVMDEYDDDYLTSVFD